MRRLETAAPLAAATLLVLGACTQTSGGAATGDPTPLTATVPEGSLMCDFVPTETAATILGGSDFTADGEVNRDRSGALSNAYCHVTREGETRKSIGVRVDFLMGMTRDSFERGLAAEEYEQLPTSEGLGFSWADEGSESTRPVGHAMLSRGDYFVEVELVPTENRAPARDAIRLAQQAAVALDIPDEWTLEGKPPSR